MPYELRTTDSWLAEAQENKNVLLDLIAEYHPGEIRERPNLRITSPGAERACSVVREKIRVDEQKKSTSPTQRFQDALSIGDVVEMMSLLSGAWFGVPESTDCWGITGFREAVSLLEDSPEDLGDIVP